MITDFVENDGAMVDDGVLSQMGVPAFRNLVNETVDDQYYFSYHHSAGDTVSVLNSTMMDQNVEYIAKLIYLIADMNSTIPTIRQQ